MQHVNAQAGVCANDGVPFLHSVTCSCTSEGMQGDERGQPLTQAFRQLQALALKGHCRRTSWRSTPSHTHPCKRHSRRPRLYRRSPFSCHRRPLNASHRPLLHATGSLFMPQASFTCHGVLWVWVSWPQCVCPRFLHTQLLGSTAMVHLTTLQIAVHTRPGQESCVLWPQQP